MESPNYPKIENLFMRDPDTHKLIINRLKDPAWAQIKGWHVTEKIDGTNMRVVYCPSYMQLSIRGRSDNAQIHSGLIDHMNVTFTISKMADTFDAFMAREDSAGSFVTLYGEGYGPGIQKGGGNYAPSKRFRLFDVLYSWRGEKYGEGLNSWATQETVQLVAEGLGILTAPRVILNMASLEDIVDWVGMAFGSQVALEDHGSVESANAFCMEGVVARTDPYLYNARGSRVMWKLKGKDLTRED